MLLWFLLVLSVYTRLECWGGQSTGGGCRNIITRRNVLDIKFKNPNEAGKYDKVLGKMKGDDSSIGFERIGQYHGKPFLCNKNQTYVGNENGCCINHWGQDDRIDLFTPWHRLYTAQMEFALNMASLQHDDVPRAMPYWDWTNPNNQSLNKKKKKKNTNDIPRFAYQQQWKNGPILGQSKVTNRGKDPNINWKVLRKMTKIAFQQKTFCDFNYHIVQPHNLVHLHLGSCPPNLWHLPYKQQDRACNQNKLTTGNMASNAYASYDPIFYLHHSYVDYQYAYYQDLLKIRNKTVVVKDPEFKMQPFAYEKNPYKRTKEHTNARGTEDYEKNFCYKFDSLKFMNLSPEQFEDKTKEERKRPSLYAANLLKNTGISSFLQFDLIHGNKTYKQIGSLATLGSNEKAVNYSEPTFPYTILYEVTDLLDDSEKDPLDKTITFKMSRYVDIYNHDLGINNTYKPIAVYRAADSETFIYRFHEHDIEFYPPEMYIHFGSRIEFLASDGSHSKIAYETLNPYEDEHKEPIIGEFSIKKSVHYIKFENKKVSLAIGYHLGCLVKCNDGGAPSSLDPDQEVIPWTIKTNNDPVSLYMNQQAMIAWCRGTTANVYQFKNEADYVNCNINKNYTSPWIDRHHMRGFLIDTTMEGLQYFANGVGDNCKKGWKITVDVRAG